jgi:hypothetical protein
VKQLVASMELIIVCKSESVSESDEAGPGEAGVDETDPVDWRVGVDPRTRPVPLPPPADDEAL